MKSERFINITCSKSTPLFSIFLSSISILENFLVIQPPNHPMGTCSEESNKSKEINFWCRNFKKKIAIVMKSQRINNWHIIITIILKKHEHPKHGKMKRLSQEMQITSGSLPSELNILMV